MTIGDFLDTVVLGTNEDVQINGMWKEEITRDASFNEGHVDSFTYTNNAYYLTVSWKEK